MNLTDWQILALAAFLSPIAVTGLLLAGSRGHWPVVVVAAVAVIVVATDRRRRHQIRSRRSPASENEFSRKAEAGHQR
jgi:hypothetical protein